ncbi:MAG: TIGR00730 family Rossman fold protein [Myxococcota bacterium]
MRITVFCGSSRRSGEPYVSAAAAVGREIARRGHALVYGGGRTGLMGTVADAVLEGGGQVHGVILAAFVAADVHHRGLTALHETSDMRQRKAGLDGRADAFIALAGGLGTLEELAEILSFRKLGFHQRPMVLLNTAGFWDPLVAQVDRFVETRFDKPAVRDYWRVTDDPSRAVSLCEERDDA